MLDETNLKGQIAGMVGLPPQKPDWNGSLMKSLSVRKHSIVDSNAEAGGSHVICSLKRCNS